jgi:hypothetical protein
MSISYQESNELILYKTVQQQNDTFFNQYLYAFLDKYQQTPKLILYFDRPILQGLVFIDVYYLI